MAKSASANRRNDENKINPGIKLTLIVVAILCVVMLVYSVCQSMGVLDRNTTAMTVGEDDISVTQLNQYYHTTRNGFLNQYGSYLSMYGYDLSSAAFDMQNCMFDSTKTWKEYFMEEAKAAAEEVSILYQEAQKAGYTMSEEDQKNYDSYLDALKNAAENNGYSVRKYVKAPAPSCPTWRPITASVFWPPATIRPWSRASALTTPPSTPIMTRTATTMTSCTIICSTSPTPPTPIPPTAPRKALLPARRRPPR